MKKITIVGLGWLGLPLAEYLSDKGYQVVGTKRQAIWHAHINCYPFSLDSPVYHEEWLNSDCLVINIPLNTVEPTTYVEAIKALILQAISQGVKHCIFISSTSVFPQQSATFDESSLTFAENERTEALITLEQWFSTLTIESDILRLAGLVGKQRHPVHYLAGKNALKGANQPVNLVHLNDCLRAIETLIKRPNGKRIYHLCSPEHPTKSEFYSYAAKKRGLPPLHFLADNSPLNRKILATKICQELNFHYQYASPFDFD